MKTKRKIIEINEDLCNGCGLCVPSCAEGAIQIIDGKVKLVSETYCDGLGACLGECPTGAMQIVEREAEEFDEAAVEAHLNPEKPEPRPAAQPPAGGCPSARSHVFNRPARVPAAAEDASGSALTHWPVQIGLVPPTAPFLEGADLLVAADCAPIAYGRFHADFLAGKVALIGCPKFDDTEAYLAKFMDVFKMSAVRSVTVVVMEVPCCQGLPMVVAKAASIARASVPVEKVTISLQGEVLGRQWLNVAGAA